MYTKLHTFYTFLSFLFLNFEKTLTGIIFDCSLLATLHSIPIAPINTDSDVPPAEINGNGMPVGGILPVNISYCIIIIA